MYNIISCKVSLFKPNDSHIYYKRKYIFRRIDRWCTRNMYVIPRHHIFPPFCRNIATRNEKKKTAWKNVETDIMRRFYVYT